jgi:hypothetical protein
MSTSELTSRIIKLAELLEKTASTDALRISLLRHDAAIYKSRTEKAEAKLHAIEEVVNVFGCVTPLEHNGC